MFFLIYALWFVKAELSLPFNDSELRGGADLEITTKIAEAVIMKYGGKPKERKKERKKERERE